MVRESVRCLNAVGCRRCGLRGVRDGAAGHVLGVAQADQERAMVNLHFPKLVVCKKSDLLEATE